MPIYKYNCSNCEEVTTAIHLSSDKLIDCIKCEHSGTLSKLLGKPHIRKTQQVETVPPGGSVTNKFIEENREILKQQKREAVKKTYE